MSNMACLSRREGGVGDKRGVGDKTQVAGARFGGDQRGGDLNFRFYV